MPAAGLDALARERAERSQQRVDSRRVPPPWFGRELAIAQHQDTISGWPLWKRWLHRKLISNRCPCCIEWKKKRAAIGRAEMPRPSG